MRSGSTHVVCARNDDCWRVPLRNRDRVRVACVLLDTRREAPGARPPTRFSNVCFIERVSTELVVYADRPLGGDLDPMNPLNFRVAML